MSAETWRVIFSDGAVCSVSVESIDGLFVASRPNVATAVRRTAHAAVLRVDGVRGHDVAEVLAPGQQSRAEMIAERDALRAAVRALTEAQRALDATDDASGSARDVARLRHDHAFVTLCALVPAEVLP